MLWEMVALEKIASIERSVVQPEVIEHGTAYLGLEHIEAGGRILGKQYVEEGELSSAKFLFTARHLLFGKLRPYLAKIALPDFDGICSTDILPVLPSDSLDRRYLAFFLRQPSLVDYADSRAIGANLPRLSPSELGRITIPLPPIEEQKRIATILDAADDLRVKRRESIAQLDALLQSTFLDMFGDPVTNPMGWEIGSLGSVSKRITDGTHQSPQWSEMGIPFLFVSNISERDIDFSTSKFISDDEYMRLTSRCPIETGDILYTTVGSYGNAVSVKESYPRFAFQRHIAQIKPKRDCIESRFLEVMLDSSLGRQQADRLVRGVAQKTLNLADLKKFQVLLPPLSLQRRFASIVEAAERQKARLRAHLDELDALFSSLQSRAFNGEL